MDNLSTIADQIGEMEMTPLPEESVSLGAIVLIKALDEDGNVCFYRRISGDIGHFELTGALISILEEEKAIMRARFEPGA